MLKPTDEGFTGDPESIKKLFLESLERTAARQELAMKMAREALEVFAVTPDTKVAHGLRAIDMRPVFTCMERTLGQTITEEQRSEIGHMFVGTIMELGGLSACLVWDIGHDLEHILFGNYVPESALN